MDPFTAIASYLILWWIALFLVLPIGVKTQEESGNVVKGSVKSAPANLNFKQKMLMASLLALGFWIILLLLTFFKILKL
jgi:predicted secreted protein